MAIRQCPLCSTKVPVGDVVAYSDSMECPGCKAPLEVSTASRMLATFLGLLAAALVWRMTRNSDGMLGWVLPMIYAVLVFGGVAAFYLMAAADLRSRPRMPLTEPEPVAQGHAAAHH